LFRDQGATRKDYESKQCIPLETSARHQFVVAQPDPAPIERLNVTDFRAYLECPYRFYLTRVLRLQSVVLGPAELDGAAFGTLLHEVLERFGASALKGSFDAAEIAAFLTEQLHELFQQRFGPAPPPAVQLQQAQMGLRLAAFAQRQADWRHQGWQIVMTEGQCRSVSAIWQVDDVPVTLRGRIDRVDRHEGSGKYLILDYKSSEEVRTPRSVHNLSKKRKGTAPEEWQDLQLPLYRHLAVELGVRGDVGLGFVTLPKALDNTAFELADWTPQELSAADEAARKVVRGIRAGVFWPPRESPGGLDRGLDRICQVGVFDRQLATMATFTAADAAAASEVES
jgi:hypothetical protein